MDQNISLLKADVLWESRQVPAGIQVSRPRWPLSPHRRDGARQSCGPPEGLGPEPQCGEGAGEPCRQLQESFLTLEPLPLRFCRAGGSARRHFDPCFLEMRRIGWRRQAPVLRRKALQSCRRGTSCGDTGVFACHNVKIKSIQEAGGSSRARNRGRMDLGARPVLAIPRSELRAPTRRAERAGGSVPRGGSGRLQPQMPIWAAPERCGDSPGTSPAAEP